MRIVVWNCNMALHSKWHHMLSLQPDIAVIPECADLDRLAKKVPGLDSGRTVWIGENPNKGLGVFSFGEYRIRLSPDYASDHRLVAPIHVSGPTAFNLLAVWSFNNRGVPGRKKMAGPILQALDAYRDFCSAAPLVVAGDFNNHVRWDRPGKPNNFTNIVDRLRALGLSSAYHAEYGSALGEEAEPTIYWRNRTKNGPSYHIDYIFLPDTWLPHIHAFSVGQYETWCAKGLSDHVPLSVDIRVSYGPSAGSSGTRR